MVRHSSVLGGRALILIHHWLGTSLVLKLLVLDSHLIGMGMRYGVRKANIIKLVVVDLLIIGYEDGMLLRHAFVESHAVLRKLLTMCTLIDLILN